MTDDELRARAARAFNRAQDLLYSQRTPAEDVEMLTSAFVSRHYWLQVGIARRIVIADWTVGRVAAELGYSGLALDFAKRAYEATGPDSPAWMRASALEGMGRAYSAAGDVDAAAEFVAKARAELALETDEHEIEIIGAQIDDLAREVGQSQHG